MALQEPRSIDKIAEIDRHIACANSGSPPTPDFSYSLKTLIGISTALFHTLRALIKALDASNHVFRAILALQEPRSIDKIAEIDRHIACANSGLAADSRTLIEHARVESQNHRFTYDEPMPVESCTQSLCDLALRFSGDGKEATMVRAQRSCGSSGTC